MSAIPAMPQIATFWARTPGVWGRLDFNGLTRSDDWGFWAVEAFWAGVIVARNRST